MYTIEYLEEIMEIPMAGQEFPLDALLNPKKNSFFPRLIFPYFSRVCGNGEEKHPAIAFNIVKRSHCIPRCEAVFRMCVVGMNRCFSVPLTIPAYQVQFATKIQCMQT